MTIAGTFRFGLAATFIALLLGACGGGVDTRQTGAATDVSGSPPVISGTPPTTAVVGQAYSFTPTASDPAGRALTFSISGQPAWLNFNTGTGALTGTPGAGNVGTSSAITISVSNGTLSASLASFTIAVQAAGSASTPTISGSPRTTATAGQAYTFTPSASDPGGATLTFSITNKPAWASFNTSTGALSGTPSAANVGSYANILITVSNGSRTASLPAFAITVAAAVVQTGSITLSWQPPTQRTDGTALTTLAGYRVYYGTRSGSYSNSVTVANPGIASYVVDAVPSGTYFVVLTAFDANDIESGYSNEATVTIP